MVNRALSNRRLLLMTLGLTYIAAGMLGRLPAASLIRLASNTHVSLEVAGRLFGAQLLRRGWMSEAYLLYAALCGGVFCGTIVAIFPGQVLVSYVASALVGCFYEPLFPSIMAITSRRFVHAIGPVSSIMIISTDATSMIVRAAMGLLIPALGINWVMAIPALCCVLVLLPMTLTNRAQPQGQTDHHDG